MLRVVLADPNQLFRSVVRELLGSQPEARVVAEAATGRELLDRLLSEPVDLLITEIGLPGICGLDAAARARQTRPHLRLVVLTDRFDDASLDRAEAADACGYVLKSAPLNDLLEALRASRRGERYFSAPVKQMVDRRAHRDPQAAKASKVLELSPREREVLQLLAEGASIKEIAAELGIGSRTVAAMRRQLMERLDAESVADLTRVAVQARLLEP